VRLFTYGTLMLPEVMEIVGGAGLRGEPARIAGFRCRALRGTVYPGLLPEQGVVTPGVLWRGLDERALARVDRFEGELYERRSALAEREGEAACEAWVYVLRPAGQGLVLDAPWDEADFRARHLAPYLRGCRSFAREEP
jgi:gamma-glutamylcyclotransferase (GGCT)/AIG2-like uncharacterized protein YtfP